MEDSGIVHGPYGGMLSLRYNDLIAPMIQVIQEQHSEIELLKNELAEIKSLLVHLTENDLGEE